MREVMFYDKKDEYAKCSVCPHNCRIKEGKVGFCGVRKYNGRILEAVNYGEVSSLALDPIEKKPLYHYKPGKYILSAGSFGCNFKCGFCQNYSISQYSPETRRMETGELIDIAEGARNQGNIGIAFTYSEPLMWYEYVYDTAKTIREKKLSLDVVLVSNGYVNEEPLRELLPFVNAFNIDLKAFRDEFYSNVCVGDIESVLRTIKLVNESSHVELTTLVIGGYNDSEDEIREMAKWIAGVNKNIPLHLSRYFPTYKFGEKATSVERIFKLRDIAREYLNHVYVGNIPGVNNDTKCPVCGEVLIKREGYGLEKRIDKNICSSCGNKVNIVV